MSAIIPDKFSIKQNPSKTHWGEPVRRKNSSEIRTPVYYNGSPLCLEFERLNSKDRPVDRPIDSSEVSPVEKSTSKSLATAQELCEQYGILESDIVMVMKMASADYAEALDALIYTNNDIVAAIIHVNECIYNGC